MKPIYTDKRGDYNQMTKKSISLSNNVVTSDVHTHSICSICENINFECEEFECVGEDVALCSDCNEQERIIEDSVDEYIDEIRGI